MELIAAYDRKQSDKFTLKLASDPLRCCKARDAINSCSSLTLTPTLPQERDIDECGRICWDWADCAGAGAGGGGSISSHVDVGTGPLQSITTSPVPPTPVPISRELWRRGGDGGRRFGKCGLLSSP